MSKRQRRAKKTRPAQSQPSSLAERLVGRLASPWIPVLFFALLSIVYFAGFVFTGDVVFGNDTGTEFHKGKEPFLEKLAQVQPANWSRYMGGTPESAGLRAQYFPLHIVALFTSEHRYFGWRYVFGMFCAGYFTFLFVRAMGCHSLSALLVGTAFASAPTILTFTFAGQFAKMSAMTLFPLQAWGLYRGLETRRWPYFLATAAGIGAAIYTPQVQIVYFSLWGLGLIFLFRTTALYRKEQNINAALFRTLLCASAICLGLAIGAEGVFPQWYNNQNTKRAAEARAEGGMEFAVSWALHPEEIASLVIPEFGHFDIPPNKRAYWGRNAFKLNTEYFGLVIVFFAVLALGQIRKDPRVLLFLVLFLFATAFSLGTHTPLYELFYHIVPGVKSLRVPGMIAFLFAFSACALAALSLDRILQESPPKHPRLLVGAGIGTAVLFFTFLAPEAVFSIWTTLFWSDIPAQKNQIAQTNFTHLQQGAILGGLMVIAIAALIWRRIQGRISSLSFILALLLITLVDTWRIDKQFLITLDPDRFPARERINANAVRFLKADPDFFRVLLIPPERQSPLYGIDLIYGFNDFSLQRYDAILKSQGFLLATQLKAPQNEPYIQRFLPILTLMNTKYIVSRTPLSIPGLSEPTQLDGFHIYKNPNALPWFYLAPQYKVEKDPDRVLGFLANPQLNPSRIALLEREPGIKFSGNTGTDGQIEQLAYDARQGYIELKTKASEPRILVISENHHPNWHAYVDGKEQPLIRANYLWKAVALPPGEHHVELRYHDPIVAFCRWITLLGTAVLIGGGIVWIVQNKRGREPDHA
ncbi:MAG: YfhO family protein [bacterium]|nr:YfhO family protein [bacterium]